MRSARLFAASLLLSASRPSWGRRQVVNDLKKRGVPVEYVLFPDEGHGFRKTPNRIRSAVSIVRWFKKHLKPGNGA